jgi:hypothetical protein
MKDEMGEILEPVAKVRRTEMLFFNNEDYNVYDVLD